MHNFTSIVHNNTHQGVPAPAGIEADDSAQPELQILASLD